MLFSNNSRSWTVFFLLLYQSIFLLLFNEKWHVLGDDKQGLGYLRGYLRVWAESELGQRAGFRQVDQQQEERQRFAVRGE